MKRTQLAKLLAKSAAAAAVACSMASAQAAIIDFRFGADVVATMTTSGSTDFLLNFTYAPATAGVAFINDLLLTGPTTGTFSHLSGEMGTACKTSSPGCAAEGTGATWKISWPTSGGPSSNRFLEGESSSFRIAPSDLTAWDFSRLHINAFLDGQSIKLTGCTRGDPACEPNKIPEPGTLALLGLGLVGLAAASRRRKQ